MSAKLDILEDPRNFRGSLVVPVRPPKKEEDEEDQLLKRHHVPGLRAQMIREIEMYQENHPRWRSIYKQHWDNRYIEPAPGRIPPRPTLTQRPQLVDPNHPDLVRVRRAEERKREIARLQWQAQQAAEARSYRWWQLRSSRVSYSPGFIWYSPEQKPVKRAHLDTFLALFCAREVSVNGELIKLGA